jgi:subtilisin family serine protease
LDYICIFINSPIQKPFVLPEAVSDQQTYSRDNLPLGALLTGAQELHAAGLTGKGVRVAVIDSGVDKNHPAFDGTSRWLIK